MSARGPVIPGQGTGEAAVGYEPPRVERALTPTDLAREVLYAGDEVSPDGAV